MADEFDVKPHQEMWHKFARLMLTSGACAAGLLALLGIFLL